MNRIFLTLVFAFLPFQSIADVNQSIKINGFMQLWERECNANGSCTLPVPVSDKVAIEATINPPANGHNLSTVAVAEHLAGYDVKLSVYWVKRDEWSYISGQTIVRENDLPLFECSHYGKDDVEVFLPVGFCSRYTSTEDGGSKQLGLTLSSI